ncbi:hypothetical protein BGZ76_009580 [Entomortierella beljakovae]|nr:hypothetical protein BGZ76_009580 [Entomortierella beljakovae]
MDIFSLMGGNGGGGDCGGNKPMVELQWYHVAIASVLILVNVLLTTLGANEAVFNASKRRHIYMFFLLLNVIVLYLPTGTRLAMGVDPLRSPKDFIPGNTMTAITLGLDQCLSQLSDNKDKIELYLSMGATRWEACRPIAVEAMRRAMTPTINQMSIIGLISIPGMMTGQLIAGASVMNAAKSQQIIMFLISGAAAFGTLSSVLICLKVCFDSNDRLRPERIIKTKSIFSEGMLHGFESLGKRLLYCCLQNPRQSVPSPSLVQGGGDERNDQSAQSKRNGTQIHEEPTERTPLVR